VALPPTFVTQYEILRTSDYVLLTLSAPTGEVVDGKMQVIPVHQISLTLQRFVELSRLMGGIAANIEAAAKPAAAGRIDRGQAPRRRSTDPGEGEAVALPADWVIRH
jgi:hypothetical protein